MVHSRKTHKRKHTRRQTGGAGWGFSGPAFAGPGGVQVESRGSYEHCYDDMRPVPAVGTPMLWGGKRSGRSRKSRRQRGGACGDCSAPAQLMRGGGAGTGGYQLSYSDNSLGKVYPEIVKAACPSQQTGGGSIYEHVAYPASYGYDTGSAYLSSSAHFLEPKADVSRCASGGSRRRYRRKSRKAGRR